MEARGDEYCFTCEQTTKYKCIACSAPVCNRCSEPELDEEVDGWRAGKSVGYCNECHMAKVEAEGAEGFTNFNEDSISGTPPCEVPSATTQANESDKNTVEERGSKLGSSKKRSGRKTQWSDQVIDDFVDIIASSEYYQRKLIFTNTKNQQNGVIYGNILVELQKRCEERGEIIGFTVIQLQNKFKKCISECKHVAMTIKTATGIKRFQEDKGFSNWFQQLFPLVQSRDSCQPEMAIEPSSSSLASTSNSPPASTSNSPSASSDLPQPNNGVEEQFIPMIKKRRLAKKDSKDHVAEVVSLLKEAIAQNPTNEMINFMKEEAERSRQHELEVLKLLLNSSSQQHQQIHPQQHQVPSQPYQVRSQPYQVPSQQYQLPPQQHQFPSTYYQHDPQHHTRSHDDFPPLHQTKPNSNPNSPESFSKQYHTL